MSASIPSEPAPIDYRNYFYTYYYTYHARFNFYQGNYNIDILNFVLESNKELTPLENWVNSILRYIRGLIRIRDMLMQDLITAIDFPTAFIVELMDIWYVRYITPWMTYYYEFSR